MPCYQVRTQSVEFKAKHADVLRKALDALEKTGVVLSHATYGQKVVVYTGDRQPITIDLTKQSAVVSTATQASLNAIKREYSRQAIMLAAQRKGWSVTTQPSNKYAGVVRR